MKQILLPILFLFMAFSAIGQEADKPGWVTTLPKAENSTYVFVRETGTGSTPGDALNRAMARVFQSTMMRIGATVSWDEVNKSLQRGAEWGTVAMQYNIPVNKVCEYMRKTNNGFVATVLCMVATSGNVYPVFTEFTGCNDINTYDNSSALLKSALLPGFGQIGKNHHREGYITMISEAVLLSGATVFYFVGKNNISEMREYANNPYLYSLNANSYHTNCTLNHIFLSAAAALYAFNLYRAYTMRPHYTDIVYMEPVLMHTDKTWTAGLNLTINF